jgi:DUF2911 family protein
MKINISIRILASFLLVAFNLSLIKPTLAKYQPVSPHRTAELIVNDKKISVEYGSPSVRGRKIIGDLVPYNNVWIMGANRATTLKTEADLMIGGMLIPKGQYTLFSFPTEKGWTLIINKQATRSCVSYSSDDEKLELGRAKMALTHLESPVEQLTISLINNNAGITMRLEWENTQVSVNFKVK